jgi:hypothetical protein
VCRTPILTMGELSCAIFPDLAVFCFLFIQKWNECRFFGGIGFVCSKGVLCVLNTKINNGRTELCNISRFGSIFASCSYRCGMSADFLTQEHLPRDFAIFQLLCLIREVVGSQYLGTLIGPLPGTSPSPNQPPLSSWNSWQNEVFRGRSNSRSRTKHPLSYFLCAKWEGTVDWSRWRDRSRHR